MRALQVMDGKGRKTTGLTYRSALSIVQVEMSFWMKKAAVIDFLSYLK